MYKVALEQQGWVYQMEVTFLEIYNEQIRDLLETDTDTDSDVRPAIKRDHKGEVYVTNLRRVDVDPNNGEQLDLIMSTAAKNRSVASTDMNARSSRSHSVFTLHMTARNVSEGRSFKSALNLVDLAGSERIERSGAQGDRLKEAVAINKSLSCLTDVFVALGNKQSHIPFRNSKLTYLLQPALSGDGKTLMMVNLSPTRASYPESLNTLRFAKQVNQVELGRAKRQITEINSGEPTTTGGGKISIPHASSSASLVSAGDDCASVSSADSSNLQNTMPSRSSPALASSVKRESIKSPPSSEETKGDGSLSKPTSPASSEGVENFSSSAKPTPRLPRKASVKAAGGAEPAAKSSGSPRSEKKLATKVKIPTTRKGV
jgi:hypothetical protein